MSMRAKFISSVVLAAIALAMWRFVSPPTGVPRVEARKPAPDRAAAPAARFETPEPAATLAHFPPAQESPAPTQSSFAESQSVVHPSALNERTLVGTKWERDGFGLEFGADGKLVIGGRERAKWRVEGSRIHLYRDTTGEEHWLDIVGNKLMWEGQEIGRVP